jgi:hypothetical protein
MVRAVHANDDIPPPPRRESNQVKAAAAAAAAAATATATASQLPVVVAATTSATPLSPASGTVAKEAPPTDAQQQQQQLHQPVVGSGSPLSLASTGLQSPEHVDAGAGKRDAAAESESGDRMAAVAADSLVEEANPWAGDTSPSATLSMTSASLTSAMLTLAMTSSSPTPQGTGSRGSKSSLVSVNARTRWGLVHTASALMAAHRDSSRKLMARKSWERAFQKVLFKWC